MNANKTQQLLLKTGARLVHTKGFNNTGIQEILQCAGVPRGSFYFYFKSKEEFGLALIEYYADMMCSMLRNYLTDASCSPIERIKLFFLKGVPVTMSNISLKVVVLLVTFRRR